MDEATSARRGFNSSVGRDPLKFLINRQLKIKALHGRVFLERDYVHLVCVVRKETLKSLSWLVACLLPKCPCCLNTVHLKAEPLLFKVLTFSLPALSLVARSADPSSPSNCRLEDHGEGGNCNGQIIPPTRPL